MLDAKESPSTLESDPADCSGIEESNALIADQAFRDTVLQTIWSLGCIGDAMLTANRLPNPMRAEELVPVLEDLVRTGALERELVRIPDTPDLSDHDRMVHTRYLIPHMSPVRVKMLDLLRL